MLVYFTLGGLALVVPGTTPPLVLLIAGFALVPLLDRHAARHGDAPAYFARLRPPQMGIAIVSLAVLLLSVSSLRAAS